MIIIALTGGIASGKTTILNFIKKLKIPTHDSDAVVNSLYNNSSKEFINFLIRVGLGNAINQKKINKQIIRNEVLYNKKKLNELEQFVHKKVKYSREAFISKNKILKKNLIVLDIPLLFEKGLENVCDYVFLAQCPLKIRIKRALKRKNVNRKNLEKIIKLQKSDKVKKNKSDFIINTAGTKNYSNKQTLNAINKIRFLNKL